MKTSTYVGEYQCPTNDLGIRCLMRSFLSWKATYVILAWWIMTVEESGGGTWALDIQPSVVGAEQRDQPVPGEAP